MSRFGNINLLMLSGVLIAGLGGCGSPSLSDSSTPVTFTIHVPASSKAGLHPFAPVPSDVDSITLEVAGEGMETITDTFPVSPDDVVTRTLEVPSGPDRIFKATAFEGLEATYEGQSIEDLAPGVPKLVTIQMKALQSVLVSIEVTPTNPEIEPGSTLQFTATGVFSDGSTQDLTTQVTWGSSDDTVAEVSNADGSKGLTTGISDGVTTITASHLIGSHISGSTHLTVTSPTVPEGPEGP